MNKEERSKKIKSSTESRRSIQPENPIFGSTSFLYDHLITQKENSDYYIQESLKGRQCIDNFFYSTTLSKNGNNIGNIAADDLGAYRSGKPSKTYKIETLKGARKNNAGESIQDETKYTIKRYYSYSKHIPNFKRQIVTIDINDKQHDFVGVRYSGVTKDTKYVGHPHASSKRPVALKRDYVRTEPRVLEKIVERAKKNESNTKIYREVADPYEVDSPSKMPRNYASINNVKQRIKAESQESHCRMSELEGLYDLQEKHFPDTMMITSGISNSQMTIFFRIENLQDVANFCCVKNNTMCMDTTFDIVKSGLWVTTISYQNQRLINNDGHHPWWLAATLLHFRKDEDIFHTFFAFLATKVPKLRELHYLGTDEEDAMYNGLKKLCPTLRRQLCTWHLWRNHEKKLNKLGCAQEAAKIIYKETFGVKKGNVEWDHGLANSTDKRDLHQQFDGLKESWNNLCPGYHEWFQKEQLKKFEDNVIQSAKAEKGIYSIFHNNGIESLHKKIKSYGVDITASQFICNVDMMMNDMDKQEWRCIVSNGEFFVTDEWNTKSVQSYKTIGQGFPPDKKRKVQKAFKAFIPPLGSGSKRPSKAGKKTDVKPRRRHNLKPESIRKPLTRSDILKMKILKKEDSLVIDMTKSIIPDESASRKLDVPYYEVCLKKEITTLDICYGRCGNKIENEKKQEFVINIEFRKKLSDEKGERTSNIVNKAFCHLQCLKKAHKRLTNDEHSNPYHSMNVSKETKKKCNEEQIGLLKYYGIPL